MAQDATDDASDDAARNVQVAALFPDLLLFHPATLLGCTDDSPCGGNRCLEDSFVGTLPVFVVGRCKWLRCFVLKRTAAFDRTNGRNAVLQP
jgi:hypothetical protein